jgi:hypothetical protein
MRPERASCYLAQPEQHAAAQDLVIQVSDPTKPATVRETDAMRWGLPPKSGVRRDAPLGSDSGGLDWTEVRSRIEKTLGSLKDVNVIIQISERSQRSSRSAANDPGVRATGRELHLGNLD